MTRKTRLQRYKDYIVGMIIEISAILVIMLTALIIGWAIVSWF